MTHRNTLYRYPAAAAMVLVALAGCDREEPGPLAGEPTVTSSLHGSHANVNAKAYGPEVSRWLAGLRQATTRFKDIEAAGDAGWDERITGCMDLPGTGGMGYHYRNIDLWDGVPQEFAPELLVYEPQKNGRRRLVAVEYAVPYTEWSREASVPPSLHGIDFHQNDIFGLWVLHAWIWKHNPAGMFVDWNPNVSCDFEE